MILRVGLNVSFATGPAVRRNETVVWLALRALASSVPAVLGSGAATAACDTAAERHRERCERRSALCTSPSLPPSLSLCRDGAGEGSGAGDREPVGGAGRYASLSPCCFVGWLTRNAVPCRRSDWEKRQAGLAKLRELVGGHDSTQWVAEHVAPLVPYLIEMLKELRSALLLDCCSTIAQLVHQLHDEPHFLREMPKLFVEVMNLPSSNALIFSAGNQALQAFIDSTTNNRLMGVIEEACANRHNHRQRARGIDCALRMLLQWPANKLRRHELELEGVLRAGCKDANAHVRASARRGAAALVLLVPKAGQRLLNEVEPGTAELVLAEAEWVQSQREHCDHGIGDGAAPIHTEEIISAPRLPEGFDPHRVDFRPPGGGPTEDEDRAIRKERSSVTNFQLRQKVKGLPMHVRNILAQAGPRLKTEFRKFDTNGDGVVDHDEMRTGLNGMQLGLSAADIEGIINIVSVYDDGAIDYAEFSMLFGKRDLPLPTKDGGAIVTNAGRPYEFTQVDQPVLKSYHGPEWLSVDEERKIKGGGRPEAVIRHGGHRETLFGEGKPTVGPRKQGAAKAPRKSQHRVRGTEGAGSLAISSGQFDPTPPTALPPSSGRRAGGLLAAAGDSRLSLLHSVGRSTSRTSRSPEHGSAADGTVAEPPTPKMPMPQMPRHQMQPRQPATMMPHGQQAIYPHPPYYGQNPAHGQQPYQQLPPQQWPPQQWPPQHAVQQVQVQQFMPQQQAPLQHYGQQHGPPAQQHHYHNHQQQGARQYAPMQPAPPSAPNFNDTFHSQMSELSGQEQRLQNELKQMGAGNSKQQQQKQKQQRKPKGGRQPLPQQQQQQGSARFGRRAAAAPPAAA